MTTQQLEAHRQLELRAFEVVLRGALAKRQPRPWAAMVGVPLGITTALLTGDWLALVPLAFYAFWWEPRDWEWNGLTAVLAGFVGAEWASVGITALAAWPNDQIFVGAVWAGAAGLLALVASRRHH